MDGSLIMTMAVRQHWLPQFYLRTFATSKGGNRLHVTYIKQVYAGNYEAKKKKIDDTAQRSHLYSLPLDDGSFFPDRPNDNGWDDGVDKHLQSIEIEAGKLWKAFQDNPNAIDLSRGSDNRPLLARFLASLHLRNPRMVAVAKYAATTPSVPPLTTEKDREKFYEIIASTPVDLEPTLEGVQDRTAFLLAQLHLLPVVEEVLLQLHWTLLYFPGNEASGPLVTSDTPIFCLDRITMDPTSMDSANCMVFCPLTSRLMLIATREPVTTPDGAVVKSSHERATALNQFIIHFGMQEAYSGFKLDESFPFLRDPPQ